MKKMNIGLYQRFYFYLICGYQMQKIGLIIHKVCDTISILLPSDYVGPCSILFYKYIHSARDFPYAIHYSAL